MKTKILVSIFSTMMLFSLFFIVIEVNAVTLTNNPTACNGQWGKCNNAFADNVNRSTVSVTNNVNRSERWNGYDFAIPSSVIINSVKVRADFYASNFRGHINVRVSGNGGATLGPSHYVGGNTAEQTFWVDVSNDVAWTPSLLSNANFRVNVTCFKNQSGSNPTCNLDYLPVEVVYTPFEYSVGVTPSSGSVSQAQSAEAAVSVAYLGGVSQTVVLSYAGCPPSATCSFNPSQGNPSYTSTLTIVTSASTSSGVYTINVTGTGDGKSKSAIYTLTVTDSQPSASASATPSTGTAPLSVNLTGTVSGGDAPLTYLWDFKDGANSTQQNPLHIFNVVGSYNISFTATDFDGDTSTGYVFITINEQFGFSVTGPTGSGISQGGSVGTIFNVFLESGTPETVTLSHAGCPASATCNFNINASLPSFSSTLDIRTSSSTPVGSYPVNITGGGGGKSHSTIFTLSVADSQPTASAGANPSSGNAPLAVNFNGAVSGGDAPLAYFWNFTDGGTSTQQNLLYTFNAAGLYNVSFKVTDNDGDVSVAYVLVNVSNAVCIRANPLVDVIPLSRDGTAGTTLNYTTQVTNQDSISCPSSTFDFDVVNPPGWSGFYHGDLVTVSPGATNSTIYSLTSPPPQGGNSSNSTLGLYNFTVYATNQYAYPTYQGNKLAFYNVI